MRAAVVLLVVLGLGGCKSSQKTQPPGGGAFSVEPASYGANANAPEEVVKKCEFEQELARSLAETGGGSVGGTGDRVLGMTIVRMQGTDPQWQGERTVIVEGELVDDGMVAGTFRIKRGARGGVLSGMMSVCQGLDTIAEDMAEDIVSWMASPTMNAEL